MPYSVGLQQVTLETIGLGRTVICILVEELWDPDFLEPQAQEAHHLCILGCWIGEGVWGKLGVGLVVPR